MSIQETLVNGSLDEFVADAQVVARLRRSDNFSDFRDHLVGLGMSYGEVVDFWNSIDLSYGLSTKRPETDANTQLSLRCGVMLDSRMFPRNLLLYRLIQLRFPGRIAMSIRTVRDRGCVLKGRWEFVDGKSRKVLHVQVLR